MQFRALTEIGKTEFAVPTNAVDLHIMNASGSYFKVLLVLLRNDCDGITSQSVCEKTGVPTDEVEEAVRYWVRCKVLPKSVICGEKDDEQKLKPTENVSLTAKEIAELTKSNSEVSFLLSSAEMIFARPITATEQKVLVSMHEWLGLPADVILMLVEYCISIEKKSIRYIEKVAVSWADTGIVTHELAEEKIKSLKQNDELSAKIKTAFRIYGRNLTTNENKYVKKWTEDYSMPLDMITYAYEITVDNTGKISFAYIDKILKNWVEKQFKTLDEAKADNTKKPTKKTNRIQFENDSFDVNQLEKMGLYDIPDVEK